MHRFSGFYIAQVRYHLQIGESRIFICRNCRNRIEHPFVLRCGRDGRAVDPGDSCEHFTDEEKRP